MNRQNKYNDNNFQGEAVNDSWNDADHKVLPSEEDVALFGMISASFTGQIDIQEAKSDPAYSETDDMVKQVIADYQKNATHNKDNEKFIRESFNGKTREAYVEKEIGRIKQEIDHSDLDKISADWVKEWHEKRQRNGGKDAKTEEIKEFITNSLKPQENITGINKGAGKKKRLIRRLVISYTMLAAAAIMGAVFLIRPLLPSYNPDNIFTKYYEPYSAVSSVTRGNDASGNETFTSALESYKRGNYQDAATGFSEVLVDEIASPSSRFFLGITQIALQDYDRAIDLLDEEAGQQGEFAKDARWYLGLAYIKAGNKAKASECFEILAQSPGFYRERSEKILRRLK
ncbi:MAG: tetratricopeptide repeat protein [Bacteroidales bacterium]|nr:tetratricopeptide repeat protein [Bacteroidales bacterium]